MNPQLPHAKSSKSPGERETLRRLIAQCGLVGLANDTKWNELIDAMRASPYLGPSFRFKCVDGLPSDWDSEWCYHLPFPMISVEWLDISSPPPDANRRSAFQKPIADIAWVEEVVRKIGLDYRQGSKMIRVFGYSPRSLELFDA